MASGGPPDKLNDRHRLVATYRSLGWTWPAIAAKVGLNPVRLSLIGQSPLFQAEVARLRHEFQSGTLEMVSQRIAAEAVPSVNRLSDLRDQGSNLMVARASASDLLDRAVPKKTQVDETRTLRLSLSPEAVSLMRQAMHEDGAGAEDAELVAAVEARPATRNGDRPAIHVETFDEALAALQEAEAATQEVL